MWKKTDSCDPELPSAFDLLGGRRDAFDIDDTYGPDEPEIVIVPARDGSKQYVLAYTDGEYDEDRPLRPGWYVFEEKFTNYRDAIDGPQDTFDEALALADDCQAQDIDDNKKGRV